MRYALITDDQVADLYGRRLCEHLKQQGYDVELLSFPAGEGSKSRKTKEHLEDELLQRHYSRDTTLIALGGGVVTDLVGFLASTFCRGVGLILIPTTLVAMVDAAIGGKTGVNTPQGKNLIGSFYFPQAIIIQPQFLATLPEKELFNGRVEMLKMGLIADREFFLSLPTLPIWQAIQHAIELKRRIVARDPYEKALRRLLNFGHTIGHALETVSNYQLSHGEAVAAGIVLEARISHAMGILPSKALQAIENAFPLPLSYDPEAVIQAMRVDKKSQTGSIHFILLQDIGIPAREYCAEAPLHIIQEVLYDKALRPC